MGRSVQNSRYKKRIHSRTLAGKRTFSVLKYSTIVRPRIASKLIKTFLLPGYCFIFSVLYNSSIKSRKTQAHRVHSYAQNSVLKKFLKISVQAVDIAPSL
uniref:Uncharacterized protein n=1 Tax=Escherichia phage fEgEco12 TaxID=3158837 RepID=A0AAU7PHQ6_9CAUD